MNSHKNARLTYQGRRILVSRMIHEGLSVREAAKAQGVRPRTAYKGLRRYREEGDAVQNPNKAPGARRRSLGSR